MLEPKRRPVTKDVIESTDRRSLDEKPRVHRPVTEKQRLERLIRMTDMALNPLEDRLERGITLSPEEQRLMMTHQTTLMKLTMSLSALVQQEELGKKSNADLARTLRRKGMDRELILALFNESREVVSALEEME